MVNFWIRDEVWKRGSGRKPVIKKKGEKKRNAERKRNKVRQIEGKWRKRIDSEDGGCSELGEREGRRCRDYHIMVARGRISCATT